MNHCKDTIDIKICVDPEDPNANINRTIEAIEQTLEGKREIQPLDTSNL